MSNNVDLYSYFAGLSVTSDDLLQAEIFARQLISAQFPDTDLREGTALSDLVIRPSATLLALINKALIFYFSQNTLMGATDTTPTNFVDKLMSNWFMTRLEGINSVINVRLYFAKVTSVSLSASTYFSTDGTLQFFPITDQSFASSSLSYDSSSNEYYFDIDLVAAQASSDYDLSSGSLLYFSNFNPYFLHGEINYLVTQAQAQETNTAFIARAESAISTRNLINIPSIIANLSNAFPIVSSILSMGFGDTPMIRDKKLVLTEQLETPIWIHLGGMADVYCRTPLTSSIIQLTTDANGNVIISGPIYLVETSSISAGNTPDTMPAGTPYTLVSQSLQTVPIITGNLTSPGAGTAIMILKDHGLENNERITIAGANPVSYNGTWKVNVLDKDTITFSTLINNTNITPITEEGITQAINLNTTYNYVYGSVGTDKTVSGNPFKAIYSFVPGSIPGVATGELTCTYIKRSSDLGFSNRHQFQASFGNAFANETISFSLYYFLDIDGIDSYLADPSNRVICADLLARGFNTTFLDISITSYNSILPSANICSGVVTTYLNKLNPGQPFIMSDLLAELYAGGVTTIQTPLDINYTKYWQDMQANTIGVITDYLDEGDPLNVFSLNSLVVNTQTI